MKQALRESIEKKMQEAVYNCLPEMWLRKVFV